MKRLPDIAFSFCTKQTSSRLMLIFGHHSFKNDGAMNSTMPPTAKYSTKCTALGLCARNGHGVSEERAGQSARTLRSARSYRLPHLSQIAAFSSRQPSSRLRLSSSKLVGPGSMRIECQRR